MGVAFVGFIIIVGIIFLLGQFVIGPILMRNTRRTRTLTQMRDTTAMEDAIRNTRQHQASPAAPPSLSTRLAQLDTAMKAGHLTAEEYAAARAAIIASP
jgi:lipase chaperone LimK